jgi:tetratricopeptide (TPR) repeat protein
MMNSSLLLFTLLVPLLMVLSTRAAQAEDTLAPDLILRVYWQQSVIHDKHQPLLISLLLSNHRAVDAALKNQESKNLHKAYEESETTKSWTAAQKQRLDKLFPEVEVPSILLGSEKQSAGDLISVQVFGENATTPLSLTARPLSTSVLKPGILRLGADNPVELLYGIDVSSLEQLPAGNYSLTATICSDGESGTWRGTSKSNSATFALRDAIADKGELWQYRYGRFHLHDANYEMAENCARNILSENPNSIAGMALHGEAAAGKGNLSEAKIAFQKAIDLYETKWTAANLPPAHIIEPPEYLLNRLHQVSELIESGKGRK